MKGQTIESVKSTVDRLEVSPSKNATCSKPVYVKMGKNKGRKGGFKAGKSTS